MHEINKLQKIKTDIEELNPTYQIEILKIIISDDSVNISENNNGIFINLTDLNDDMINKLENFIRYVKTQQVQLANIEIKKDVIKKTFFINNKNKTDKEKDNYNITTDAK